MKWHERDMAAQKDMPVLGFFLRKKCVCPRFRSYQRLTDYFAARLQLNSRSKSRSWCFTPHPTKEDCSSYPPWMLQDAPSEVTCISYWSHTPIKIA
ncbi:Uncharacterised protein [Shewanella baltica]|nr:Uncharacterised protein [Shewanella baltica]